MPLDKMFNPQSIAVIGASNNPGKVGYSILKNLIDANYKGKIFPINLKDEKVHGLKAYPSILEINSSIDLGIVIVPAPAVPSIIEDCAKKEIKNIIIISAGFSETGEEGKALEEKIRKIANEKQMNIVGPNTLGIINAENGLNASFAATFPKEGSIAFVSQSGALCTAILDWARGEGIGFSKFISTGNKSFMSEADYFSYLEKDTKTKAVFAYMESVKDADAFIKAAYSLAKKKPVVILKSGRSAEGQKAASSHTGAMSVDDKIFSVACKKANVLRVNSVEGMFDLAKLLSKINKFEGFKIAVVTNAGGPGVIIADSASNHGFELPKLHKKTIEAVKENNPLAVTNNPLDLIGDAKPIHYRTALTALQEDPEINIIYTIVTPQSMTDPEQVADIVIELNKSKPIICSFIGGTAVSHPKQLLRENGIVEYSTPERGIKALSRLKEYYDKKGVNKLLEQKTLPKQEIKKMLSGKKQLTMEESFTLLKEGGIATPKTIFFSKKSELDFDKIQFPVALKTATGLAHKTDYGLVKIGIKDKKELEEQIDFMSKKSKEIKIKQKFVIQEMIQGKFILVSGITTEFGKVITYGLGGIFVEIMKDVSQKIAPLTDQDIDDMLAETKGTKVLQGFRTKKKYDIDSLKKTIKHLSTLALTYPEIKEIELNPVIVTEKGCYAVDAVITL